MSGVESFIEKQTKLLETQPAEAPGKGSEHISEGCVDDCVSGAAVPARDLSNSDPGKWQKGARAQSTWDLGLLGFVAAVSRLFSWASQVLNTYVWGTLLGFREEYDTVPELSRAEERGT